MNIYRYEGKDPVQFHLELSSDEYDQVYFALRKHADVIASDIAATARGERGDSEHAAEEFMFLGTVLGQTATLLFEMEQETQNVGDTRWP